MAGSPRERGIVGRPGSTVCVRQSRADCLALSLHLAASVHSWFAVSPEPVNLILRTESPARRSEGKKGLPQWPVQLGSLAVAVWQSGWQLGHMACGDRIIVHLGKDQSLVQEALSTGVWARR